MAGPFLTDTTRISQGTATAVSIRGIPGESFRIAYVDDAGVARTKTVTLTNLLPQLTTVPAKAGTAISISNLTQPGVPAQNYIAQRFTPPGDTAVTQLAMNPGSTLTAFGQTFELGGSFATTATAVNYDAASAGYGTLSGIVPSSGFGVFGQNNGDVIGLALDGGGSPFLLNVASTWDAAVPDTGLAVPFSQLLSGTLTFMGNSLPFTGLIDGTVTFFSGNQETIAASIVLNGIGSGAFSATGRTAIPEPAALYLLASALMVMGAAARLHRR